MSKNRIYTLVISVFILATVAVAQPGGIAGIVQDSANAAVPNATVVLRDLKTGVELIVSTDAEGRFSFASAGDPAQYAVIISVKGFGRVTKPLATGESNIVVPLMPGELSEEVTVTATRTQILTSETAVPVSVVGREEIDRKAVRACSKSAKR